MKKFIDSGKHSTKHPYNLPADIGTCTMQGVRYSAICAICKCPLGEHWGKSGIVKDMNCPIYENDFKEK